MLCNMIVCLNLHGTIAIESPVLQDTINSHTVYTRTIIYFLRRLEGGGASESTFIITLKILLRNCGRKPDTVSMSSSVLMRGALEHKTAMVFGWHTTSWPNIWNPTDSDTILSRSSRRLAFSFLEHSSDISLRTGAFC